MALELVLTSGDDGAGARTQLARTDSSAKHGRDQVSEPAGTWLTGGPQDQREEESFSH